MSGAIPPLPQYAFMAWSSVKSQGYLYLNPRNVNGGCGHSTEYQGSMFRGGEVPGSNHHETDQHDGELSSFSSVSSGKC